MQCLYQPQAGVLTVKYQPNQDTVIGENPPSFTWMPGQLGGDHYILQVATEPDFSSDTTTTIQPIHFNFYKPDQPFKAGKYYWRYALLNNDSTQRVSHWSHIRTFNITDNLPITSIPSREQRFNNVDLTHPRLWLNQAEAHAFSAELQKSPDYCGWQRFYQKSVIPWLTGPLIEEPAPYPNNKRVVKLWRKSYTDSQNLLYAVRHLSVAGVILQDSKIIERAKEWLLHGASWDPEGTTSRDYNDESAFRVAGALAWGFDWLYDYLTDEQRAVVQRSLLTRTEQVAQHVITRSKIHQVPYDSHAVRSLSSVIVPCCIALLRHQSVAEEWLNYALDYYSTLYTPWGGADGGWAEGPHYWTTGMACVIDALNLIKKFTGIDFYQRPFFQKTGDFPLYCFSPDAKRTSFGDIANLGDEPGLKVGYNMRQFAGVTGNGLYQWYYQQVQARDVDAESQPYNYSWWDFAFDDLMYNHDYPEILPLEPHLIEKTKWFKDVGWVAFHHRMDDPEVHIQLITKSSPYGSISHSHGDQNSFVLHAFGEPLAIHSGYYVAFNSTMHQNWRRQTRSKNCILIDGQGQYAGKNKVKCMEAKGRILRVVDTVDYSMVQSDATDAYRENVPELELYVREIYFINSSYFVIVDNVDLQQEASVQWLFHTLQKSTIGNLGFEVNGVKAKLDGQFVYCSSGELVITQSNGFHDVDPQEIAGMDNHWQLTATTKTAKRHRIVTLLVPYKTQEKRYVSHFLDDQDHGINLYFTDNGKTFMLEVEKPY